MAFTEAQLLAQIASDGAGCQITAFIPVGTTATDVYIQNDTLTSRKTGGLLQIAQTNTAAQAATLMRAFLSA